MSLFHPAFFAPIVQYTNIIQSENIVFETQDNYLKQTYRNRCRIYTANGKQDFSIAINKNASRKTKDITVDYSNNWNRLFIKTLDAAYSSSPFYDYYKDDIISLLDKKQKYLLDLNMDSHSFVMDILQVEKQHSFTNEFEIPNNNTNDFRHLINAKQEIDHKLKPYFQVFSVKHGFISNLSILDIIFMEGPATSNYLLSNSV
ncbi:MAG: WbqC family protein [Flavobacteriaceae bacterium]|nr:WbqC family protein [Flavobacteriaceae bacterium]